MWNRRRSHDRERDDLFDSSTKLATLKAGLAGVQVR
jgi:hypothetical protein